MSTAFPVHTVLAIVGVMFVAAAATWYALSQALERVPMRARTRRMWRWGAAIVLGGWLLARLAFTVGGAGEDLLAFFPYTAGFIAFGVLVGLGLLVASETFRQIVRAAPQTWLVGTQSIRLAGFLFLALLDMGRLPPQFALPAGYGDMLVGALALITLFALQASSRYARQLVLGVNILGLLDFVSALATGLGSIGPFALQVQAAGTSAAYLNYVLIVPAFGVPLYALLHVYSLLQLASTRPVEKEVPSWSAQPLAS